MKFQQFYSGSAGNLYIVTATNGRRMMVECGVKWPRIQAALGYNLAGIVGCLVSHSHGDHAVAARNVVAAGLDIYASQGTLEALNADGLRRFRAVAANTLIRLDGFEVLPFEVHHDAVEPLGFVIRDRTSGEFMLFATDTCKLTQRFTYKFEIIAIECSYDREVLRDRVESGSINESLARRLLDAHMERQNTILSLTKCCDLSRCTEIHLLHCSGENLDRESARKEVEDKFLIPTRTVGQ